LACLGFKQATTKINFRMIDYFETKSQPISKIQSLELGTTNRGNPYLAVINKKSRMKGDFHVRFRGKAGVRFPCLTRLWCILKDDSEI
jgi:hypothetical protein